MEDAATTTIDTGAELDSQPAETTTDSQETETAQAEPAQAEKASKPDIKKLLEREKNDPNFRMTDAEQDVYDAYIEKLDAEKQKPKNKTPEPEEDGDEETADEKPAPKPKAKEEKEPEAEDEEKDLDPDAKALLKEVGAKNLKEAHAKLKDLRKLVGGKDAQAVARLEREKADLIGGQRSLWEGLQKGDPKAIAFAEKTFGVKFAGKAEAQPQTAKPTATTADDLPDPEQSIDPESTRKSNAIILAMRAEIKELKEGFGMVKEERDRHIQETVHKSSVMSVVDEMAAVAQRIPALKSLVGFREAAEGVLNGKADPRLDVFQELFEIAKAEGCSLKAAFDIKRGRDSDREIATAKEAGRKEAYNVKPNPSLSGATGGRGEAAYQPVTDAMLEKWESDHTTHPKEWYDDEMNLIESKIPKRAHHIFGIKAK